MEQVVIPRKYPSYKDSGVEWLGEVPEHWEKQPGKACFTERKVPNIGLIEKTVLSLSYGKIIIKPPEKLHGLVPTSFETYQIVEPGDIIIRPTDLQNDWNSLRFGISYHRGIITSAYMRFVTKPILDREYAHLLLHTYDLMKVFYGLGSGLRQNLDWSDFKYLPCLVPPLPEQTAIVRYLDYMDHRIRRFINAKKKLIALLEEEKQAIIHNAVTRGLDPDVRLKPSGVEWLGDVPEHWRVRRIKNIFQQIIGGSTPSGNQPDYWDGDIIWVTPADVSKNSQLFTSLRKITKEGFKATSLELAPSGSLIITSRAPVGNVAVAQTELCTNQGCKTLIPNYNTITTKFGYKLLKTLKSELQSLATGTTFTEISRTKLGDIFIPLPPLPEQNAIISYLDQTLERINSTITHAQRQITLLQEYRTRLIADVVTGKLDVREAAANLNEIHEESDLFDEEQTSAEYDEEAIEVNVTSEEEEE